LPPPPPRPPPTPTDSGGSDLFNLSGLLGGGDGSKPGLGVDEVNLQTNYFLKN